MNAEELVKLLVVTAETLGTDLSEGAATLIASELASFPPAQVRAALRRCRYELKGRLTMAAIIERLDDGRPGPDEAWALLPASESQTVVWTDEVAHAFGIAGPLLDAGDKVGARLAFKEAYTRRVADAREQRLPVNWWPTLGHDEGEREAVIMKAVDCGRLELGRAIEYLPLPAPAPAVVGLLAGAVKKLG